MFRLWSCTAWIQEASQLRFNRLLTKPIYDTKLFYYEWPCTNWGSCAAITKKILDSFNILYNRAPQVSSYKLSPARQVLPVGKAPRQFKLITPTWPEMLGKPLLITETNELIFIQLPTKLDLIQSYFIKGEAMHESRLMCSHHKKCWIPSAFSILSRLRCLAINSTLHSKYKLGGQHSN